MVHQLTLLRPEDGIRIIQNEKEFIILTVENKQLQTIVELDKSQVHDLIGILTFVKNRM